METFPSRGAAGATPTRFVLVPVVAVLVVTAALLALAYALMSREIERRTVLRLQHRAATLAQRVDAGLHDAQGRVRLAARQAGALPGADPAARRADLEFIASQDERFTWIGLVGLDGRVVAATKGWLEGQSISARPVFERARERAYVGDAHAAVALAALIESDVPGSRVLLDIGEPVRDAQGRTVAVLAAHLDVRWIERMRREALGELEGQPLPATALFLLSTPASQSVLPGEAPPQGLPLRPERPGMWRAVDGERWFAAVHPLGEGGRQGLLPWHVLALQEKAAALAPVRQTVGALALFGLLAALIVGLASAVAARRLIRPWVPLFEAVLRRTGSAGDSRALADAVSAYLGSSAAGGRVPSEVESVLSRLAEGTRDLRRMVDHLPVGVALIDGGFRVQYLNLTYTRLLGWTTEQVRGRIAAEFLFDAATRAEFVRQFECMGEPPGEVAARFDALRADGQRVAIQWHFVPIVEDGRFAGAIAVITDIRGEREARARAAAMAGRLRALADAAVDVVFATLDAQGRVLEWSAGAAQLSGHAPGAAIGRRLDLLLCAPSTDDAAAALDGWLLRARRDGQCQLATEFVVADGRRRWFEGALYALGLAPGQARFGLVLHDTTPVREALAELETSEARLAAIIEGASDAIVSTTADGRVTLFNPAASRIFGRPADDVVGGPLDRLLPPAQRDGHGGHLVAFERSGVSQRAMGVGRVRGLHADGRTLELEASISQCHVGGQSILTAILRDVTERVAHERDMEAARAELASLAARLLEQEKETTRRLAQALHDELGQTLAALRLHWDAWHGRAVSPAPEDAAAAALGDRIGQLLVTANRQIRGVLRELRPPMLDEFGLVAALDNEIRQQRPAVDAPVLSLQVPSWVGARRWPADVEYAAFMVCREALANALCHAQARAVGVEVDGDDDELRIRVLDDGVGPVGAADPPRPGHLGLVGMRERAQAIGARLRIDAGPGGLGTCVTLHWSRPDEPDLPG